MMDFCTLCMTLFGKHLLTTKTLNIPKQFWRKWRWILNDRIKQKMIWNWRSRLNDTRSIFAWFHLVKSRIEKKSFCFFISCSFLGIKNNAQQITSFNNMHVMQSCRVKFTRSFHKNTLTISELNLGSNTFCNIIRLKLKPKRAYYHRGNKYPY